MSRYMLDKLLWQIDRDDEALEAYLADPAGYVAAWERSAAEPRPPHPDGGTLTAEERAAVVAVDAPAMYELGAHPYLLWHYVRSVILEPGMSPEQLDGDFKAGIRDRHPPDLTTWL